VSHPRADPSSSSTWAGIRKTLEENHGAFRDFAQASGLAYDFTPDHTRDRTDGPWSLGWEFTVNTPILVTALDFWDNPLGPLTLSHDIAIYDSTKTAVAFRHRPDYGSSRAWCSHQLARTRNYAGLPPGGRLRYRRRDQQ
jgi:hypothetical protein